MKKVVGFGLLISALLTVLSYEAYPELAGVPLSALISLTNCTLVFIIDRYGFPKVDTVKLINDNPWLYPIWIGFYVFVILASCAIAFYVTGG